MEVERTFIIVSVLLIVTAAFASSSNVTDNLTNRRIATNEYNISSECGDDQSIPCNWEGWRHSYPEVRCPTRRSCDRYSQVLSMKCRGGVLSEARVERICTACQESPGL